MNTDNYQNGIKRAGWTYLEARFCPFHVKTRRKLKWVGRLLKKQARRLDAKDIKGDLE